MKLTLLGLSLALVANLSHAEQKEPAIKGFSFYYTVPNHTAIDEQTRFKVPLMWPMLQKKVSKITVLTR